jgi:hypothetical protein
MIKRKLDKTGRRNRLSLKHSMTNNYKNSKNSSTSSHKRRRNKWKGKKSRGRERSS